MSSQHDHEALSAHLDGELEPRERRGVEAHLEQCPECRAVRDEFVQTQEALRSWVVTSPPLPAPKILGHDRKPQRQSWRALVLRPRWVLVAAGLGAVIVGSALLMDRGSTEGPSEAEEALASRIEVRALGDKSHLIILKGRLSGLEAQGYWREP